VVCVDLRSHLPERIDRRSDDHHLRASREMAGGTGERGVEQHYRSADPAASQGIGVNGDHRGHPGGAAEPEELIEQRWIRRDDEGTAGEGIGVHQAQLGLDALWIVCSVHRHFVLPA
jgi:hypothetical protein